MLDDGSMVCWGGGNDGALGNVGLDDMFSPSYVSLPEGSKARSVSVGPSVTCTILDNQSVMCWGYNDFGQLGGGNISEGQVDLPSFHVSLPEGTKAIALDSGSRHSCIISSLRSLFCWGHNGNGQLGGEEFLGEIPTSVQVVQVQARNQITLHPYPWDGPPHAWLRAPGSLLLGRGRIRGAWAGDVDDRSIPTRVNLSGLDGDRIELSERDWNHDGVVDEFLSNRNPGGGQEGIRSPGKGSRWATSTPA